MIAFDEKVVRLTETLTEAGIPHAVGGAIALGYYAVPRATIDIDLNVFLEASATGRVARVLREIDIQASEIVVAQIERDGQGRLRWESTPIDVFFVTDEFHRRAAERSRDVPFPPDRIAILAPEDLLVCKAVYDRPKDRLDIEQMLLATAGELDLTDVRRWLTHLVGGDDRRVRRLDAAIERVLGPRT